jgi:hypothetical protein
MNDNNINNVRLEKFEIRSVRAEHLITDTFFLISEMRGVQFIKLEYTKKHITYKEDQSKDYSEKEIIAQIKEGCINGIKFRFFPSFGVQLVEMCYIVIKDIFDFEEKIVSLDNRKGYECKVSIEMLLGVRLPMGSTDYYISELRSRMLLRFFDTFGQVDVKKVKLLNSLKKLEVIRDYDLNYKNNSIDIEYEELPWVKDHNWMNHYVYFACGPAYKCTDIKKKIKVNEDFIPKIFKKMHLQIDIMLYDFLFNLDNIHNDYIVFLEQNGIEKEEDSYDINVIPPNIQSSCTYPGEDGYKEMVLPFSLVLAGFKDKAPISVHMLINLICFELCKKQIVIELRYQTYTFADTKIAKIIDIFVPGFVKYVAVQSIKEREEEEKEELSDREKKYLLYIKKVVYLNELKGCLDEQIDNIIKTYDEAYMYRRYIPLNELQFLVNEYRDEAINRILANPRFYLWTTRGNKE